MNLKQPGGFRHAAALLLHAPDQLSLMLCTELCFRYCTVG
jgi:hypothetical protein